MLVVIGGLIGAGKSTLCEKLDGNKFFEPLGDSGNPYLNDYYKDPSRWCFPMQVHLLFARWEMIRRAHAYQTDGSLSIGDRSIMEDWAFAYLGFKSGYMTEREYETYCKMHETLVSTEIPLPDLMIYLHAPISTLIEHIRTRDRDCEANLMEDYLIKLQSAYDILLPEIKKKIPVVTIDATLPKDEVHRLAVEAIKEREKYLSISYHPRYHGGM